MTIRSDKPFRSLWLIAGLAMVLFGGVLAGVASPPPARAPQKQTPWKQATEAELRKALAGVPEVALDKYDAGSLDAGGRNAAWTSLSERAAASREQTRAKPPAGFIERLEQERTDLAGLPFRKGKACIASHMRGQLLAALGRETRAVLRTAGEPGQPGGSPKAGAGKVSQKAFWASLATGKLQDRAGEDTLAVLQQLLLVEDEALRHSFVADYLRKRPGKAFSVALAERAVFDLDEGVRSQALAALKERPAEEYVAVLTDALRYPWVPVARRGAEALAALKLKQAIPRLVGLLGERAPGVPFLAKVQGKKVLAVRELVRVNHLRNCLLCHPVSSDSKDTVRGPVPVPDEPLPEVYYDRLPDGIFVRADVTYLRQDFSLTETVAEPGR